ncbi:hypothetical protein BC567DRAFT_38672 [Phyllosticta citribraziliensis]
MWASWHAGLRLRLSIPQRIDARRSLPACRDGLLIRFPSPPRPAQLSAQVGEVHWRACASAEAAQASRLPCSRKRAPPSPSFLLAWLVPHRARHQQNLSFLSVLLISPFIVDIVDAPPPQSALGHPRTCANSDVCLVPGSLLPITLRPVPCRRLLIHD